MDTSETYIKMRRQAIADLGMGQLPSFSMGAEVIWHTTFVCSDIKGDFYYSDKDEGFQLERQDQLQEMVKTLGELAGHYINQLLLLKLIQFIETCDKPYQYAHSMEQLWLAFVMKEKYNKVWNGEDWIKEAE